MIAFSYVTYHYLKHFSKGAEKSTSTLATQTSGTSLVFTNSEMWQWLFSWKQQCIDYGTAPHECAALTRSALSRLSYCSSGAAPFTTHSFYDVYSSRIVRPVTSLGHQGREEFSEGGPKFSEGAQIFSRGADFSPYLRACEQRTY